MFLAIFATMHVYVFFYKEKKPQEHTFAHYGIVFDRDRK